MEWIETRVRCWAWQMGSREAQLTGSRWLQKKQSRNSEQHLSQLTRIHYPNDAETFLISHSPMYLGDITSAVLTGNFSCGAQHASEFHAFGFIDVVNAVSRL